ncbi:MAG TPA: tRNA pseudouridine(38-40) synthase TruA [Candidatus Angelobacter sp.]|nr:tRNA pseudouridine(38-40) synthase TruA [Candidatus Angelobacter sp.]
MPDPASSVEGPRLRLRLDLAYDGTGFHGWARQPGLRTVQGELEAALTMLLRASEPVRVACAGRTDAGVHARGQVAHADVAADQWDALASRGADVPVRRLAGLLPDDVRVRAVHPAPPGFDARWSASSRTYAYRVSDLPGGADPLLRSHVLYHAGRRGGPLDVDAMNAAASALIGEHDFAAYCRRREGASTVRTLLDLRWERETDSGLAVMWIRADAFCHSMVRSVVGALLPVGDGRRPLTWPAEILAGTRREPDADVAPSVGLCLERVEYPPDADLANQAQRARRFRGPDAG